MTHLKTLLTTTFFFYFPFFSIHAEFVMNPTCPSSIRSAFCLGLTIFCFKSDVTANFAWHNPHRLSPHPNTCSTYNQVRGLR